MIIPCKKAANEEAVFDKTMDKTTYSCTFSKMIRNQSTKNNSTTIEKTKVANSM